MVQTRMPNQQKMKYLLDYFAAINTHTWSGFHTLSQWNKRINLNVHTLIHLLKCNTLNAFNLFLFMSPLCRSDIVI